MLLCKNGTGMEPVTGICAHWAAIRRVCVHATFLILFFLSIQLPNLSNIMISLHRSIG